MVGLDRDGRVLLMHSLFSVRVNVYSIQLRLFACLVNLPAKGLPLVVDIPAEAFAARRYFRDMPQVDLDNRLWGISPLNW